MLSEQNSFICRRLTVLSFSLGKIKNSGDGKQRAVIGPNLRCHQLWNSKSLGALAPRAWEDTPPFHHQRAKLNPQPLSQHFPDLFERQTLDESVGLAGLDNWGEIGSLWRNLHLQAAQGKYFVILGRMKFFFKKKSMYFGISLTYCISELGNTAGA